MIIQIVATGYNLVVFGPKCKTKELLFARGSEYGMRIQLKPPNVAIFMRMVESDKCDIVVIYF